MQNEGYGPYDTSGHAPPHSNYLSFSVCDYFIDRCFAVLTSFTGVEARTKTGPKVLCRCRQRVAQLMKSTSTKCDSELRCMCMRIAKHLSQLVPVLGHPLSNQSRFRTVHLLRPEPIQGILALNHEIFFCGCYHGSYDSYFLDLVDLVSVPIQGPH